METIALIHPIWNCVGCCILTVIRVDKGNDNELQRTISNILRCISEFPFPFANPEHIN